MTVTAEQHPQIHPVTDPAVHIDLPTRIDVDTLRSWLTGADRPLLIDVRSAAEFRSAHIPTAFNVPLPLLKDHKEELTEALGQQSVLICRTDRRAGQAEEILAASGLSRLHVLTGGMTTWMAEGAPVVQGEGRWDLERQVRLVAGGLVVSGIVTSTFIPRAKWLSGAIGCGLMAAALTDSCMMGSLLSKLPYNRELEPDLRSVLTELGH
ncbi:rhodanese-like domain-containing protein [Austwickia chelonae]|uniref:rhodanese-like domain-containing protein n=1 Tax=Austwickia chelonae TaxID=100225 RepID=UPI000E2850E2|nr:rhodanese-like domain-containing protein [Austwickia chelonae]